jgi:hypothetical protein
VPGAVPAVALAAYRDAAAVTARLRPGCRLDWALLAAIGAVESAHGQVGGARLGSDGVARPPILGPRLDGHLAGTAVIGDSDGGRLDGDRRYDRAVGPMQFLPRTWAAAGVAARAGATPDPQNVRDAALSAAGYLCRAGGDLSTASGRRTAVLAYNASERYLDAVLALADRFAGNPPRVVRTPPAPTRPTARPTSAPPSPRPTRASPSRTPRPSPTSRTPSPTSTTPPTSLSPSTTTTPPTSLSPSPAVRVSSGGPGTLEVRWEGLGADGAVRLVLERSDGIDGWQAVGDDVTVAAGEPAEHRWEDVDPGRYRVVLQPLDADGDPTGDPLVGDEVTVASGAPTP